LNFTRFAGIELRILINLVPLDLLKKLTL